MSTPDQDRWSIALSTVRSGMEKILAWAPIIALSASSLVHAQTWPAAKPVRIVVPVAAGGTTDILARLVGQGLGQNLGQQFLVDYKPGAAGAIGSVEVARAPADGYTLLVATSSSHSVAPAVYRQLRYNPVDDFTPIAHLADSNTILLVSPSVEARDVRELIELARKKPGFLNYISAGNGSFGHLTFALFARQAGVQLTHVPYKGQAAAFPDLMSGVVHLAADAIPSAVPHVKEGRLRGMAVTGPRRSSIVPNIPTIAESGLPEFAVLAWFGIYGPRGMQPALARRINEEINKVLQSPETVSRFASLGIEAARGTPAEFGAMAVADTERWTRLTKELGLKLEAE